MNRPEPGFSIVDFLMIVAILLILSGVLGPYFAEHRQKVNAAQATHPTTTTQAAR